MKVLAPLFALFVFAFAQEFQDLQLTIVSPTQGQQVPLGSNLTVQRSTRNKSGFCFVVRRILSQRLKLINPLYTFTAIRSRW